jgi:tetratricopeptide (TPR) repeat protein
MAPIVALLASTVAAPASGGQGGDGRGAAAYSTMMREWSAGHLDAALKAADTVLQSEPRNVTYLNAIGGLYCDQAQKASVLTRLSWAGKCHGTWERAVAIDPRNIDVRLNLIQYYLQAPGIAGGGVSKAKDQANAIAALDPVRGEIAWGGIGRSEKQLGEAERHYRRAAEVDRDGIRGPVALANFYASQKRWGEAQAVFERRLATDATDTFAAFHLGRLLQAQGTGLQKALALFDQYLAAPSPPGGPTHADAWFRKGEVLLKLGKKAEATVAFESALKLAPDHRAAARELGRIKGI